MLFFWLQINKFLYRNFVFSKGNTKDIGSIHQGKIQNYIMFRASNVLRLLAQISEER